MEFREHTLDNGLEVVAECNDDARSTAVGFFVKTGARDETDAVSGVSHFLEHMVFKGTPTRTADDVNRVFDEMGAHYNAFTSEESTVYYAAVLPEFQHASIELLADILRPSLRKEDFVTEKQVILEEIKMYEDQPPFGADDIVRAHHFGSHPLGRSVLGTRESINDLSVDAMHEYFRRRYSPTNIVLVGAGKIDFDAMVATAQECCGSWERFDAKRTIERASSNSGFEQLHRESASQEYAIQLAAAPGATDDDRFAAKVLATVVGDDSGSRLYWEMVDPGLAESVSLGHHDYHGTGLYITYLSCSPDETEGNLQRLLDTYRRVESDGVTAEELDQAKNKINSRVVLGSERPRGRLFNVGGNWTYRREHRTVADDLAAVDAVSLEALRAVVRKYPLSTSTTIVVGPLKDVKAPT